MQKNANKQTHTNTKQTQQTQQNNQCQVSVKVTPQLDGQKSMVPPMSCTKIHENMEMLGTQTQQTNHPITEKYP